MPTSLSDLPPELLPALLEPLVRRQDLYNVCLVNREWAACGQSLLYRRISLFGRDLAIASQLFHILASNPRLAALVKTLHIRVWPLSLIVKERLAMEDVAVKMLTNCVNVEELVFTRKGSLTDRVFEAITSLPRLRTFELNAHTNLSPGSWSASHLLDLPPLRSLSLILPDRNIASILPAFLSRQRELLQNSRSEYDSDGVGGPMLEELSILCRESTVINDTVVSSLAPVLAHGQLHSLALAGCPKLTGAPLLTLLPHLPHLRNLALEACNLDPSFYSAAAPFLTRLESLKLTHPGPRHPTLPAFFPALESLLEQTKKLRAFTLYHSGASATGRREWPIVPGDFVEKLAAVVGDKLRKFEVSGVLIQVEAVEVLTNGATVIRDLVLHLGHEFDLPRLTASFAPLSSLRTLHLLSQRADVSPDDVLTLAEQCAPTLSQIGFRNRVWIVRRAVPPRARSPVPDPDPDDHRAAGPEEPSLQPPARAKIRLLETAAAFGAFRRNRYGAEDDVDVDLDLDAGESSSSSSSEDEQE
ncbi:hypothetical protein JCM1840_004713 [Sporobolomyces johnsonii]